MPKRKKPSAGPGAARFRAAFAQGRGGRDFTSAALKEAAGLNNFTLKDEARNTGHHSSPWGRASNLRAKPVSFVSAGLIEPLKEKSTAPEDDDDSPEELPETVTDPETLGEEVVVDAPQVQEDESSHESPQPPVVLSEPSLTTKSTAPDTVVATVIEEVVIDKPVEVNDEPSKGMDFVIDVAGDKTLSAKLASRPAPKIPEPQSSAEDSDSSAEVILFKGRGNHNRTRSPAKRTIPARVVGGNTVHVVVPVRQPTPKPAPQSMPQSMPDPVIVVDSGTGEAGARRTRSPSPAPDADADTAGPNLDKLLASENEEDAIIADYIANMMSDSGEDSDGNSRPFLMRDLGDGNTWAEDASSDDDSGDSGDDEFFSNLIGADGSKDILAGEESGDEDETASPTIDDETMARLLAKQEELGLGSDELILFGGQEMATSYTVNTGKFSSRTKAEAHIIKGRRKFPSASAVADAFDELDLMDWERPSLQNPRKGGRRGKAPPDFDVSDSELEDALQTAWVKDRETKKIKKLQREELRAQGLLGKHANPDDPRLKYPTGMTLDDITNEMRDFLIGSEPLLQLPPMDKHSRKVLHDLANKFKIKSQSTGSGNQRRPTLHRTKYTARYVESHFEVAVSHIERKHFPRLDLKGKGKGKAPVRRGAGSSAVRYMEGEIVGASAPVIGEQNKGRNMLEKMGWSFGMGLGSVDNKGILQPVAQVVKNTKAGLG